ncbi:MAG: C45 family peptidase [Burkholderiales bacterium]|nr:C45 family peptidase [Burkholderiales bacterium]
MSKLIASIFFGWFNLSFACTSFGVITESETIIGKNRDFMYSQQNFELVQPIRQFDGWYGNPYQHKNEFYALMARNDVKFGVNKFGLVAIEEDPMFPTNASNNRRYMQPYLGYSEGMTLYGILQNFSSVNEIIPYINQIFSISAPNFYQIADSHSILTVEVAFGDTESSPTRKFSYKIINKAGDYFTHTNTYLDKNFEKLNQLPNINLYSIDGSKNRLNKITNYVKNANGDFSNAFNWYLDTKSAIKSPDNKKFCLNTSVFRSDIKMLTKIRYNTQSDTVYGTVSSFMVQYKGSNAQVHVRVFYSLDVLKNGDQKITYNELNIPLDKLFLADKLDYTMHSFIRKAPVNETCN